jgi:advillin
LKTSSLNEGDVFILDAGLNLFQWNGRASNKWEKFKGLEMVTAIKDKERGGKAKVTFLESGTPNPDDALFWKTLGGKEGIKDEKSGGADDDVKEHVNELFRISDATGSIVVTPVARGRLEKKMLDPTDVFLLDVGSQVFVWIGKEATKEERNKGMSHGAAYLASAGRPSHTPLTRVVGGGETPVFKSYFVDFSDPRPTGPAPAKTAAPKRGPDTSALYSAGGGGAAEEKMPDKGDGKVEIWRVEGFAKEPVDAKNYGQFFAGDSYLILYSYQLPGGKPAWIIYFWQGRDSSLDEKASSALLAVDMDRELGGSPVQVRVVQSKEPNHFLTLFKGKMVVHNGGKASGFKNRADVDSYDTDGVSLYHIKGTTELNTRAVQVPEVAASLNSGDCFALLTPTVVYIWQGKGSNPTERKTAQGTAAVIKGARTVTLVEEGKEPDAFWSAVGGKGEYPQAKEEKAAAREPRLFHCSSNHGHFHVEEIFNFTQDDLIDDDVMILDTYSEVFVWVGTKATREEKDTALTTALDFVTKAPDGRSADTPIYKVHPGGEPPNFTCHFLGWNPAKVSAEDPYSDALVKLKGGAPAKAGAAAAGPTSPKAESKGPAPAKAAPAKVEAVTRDSVGYLDWSKNAYTIDQLKAGVPNIDPANKPLYLADSAFTALFKMSKQDFIKLAKWKSDAEKKKAGLF